MALCTKACCDKQVRDAIRAGQAAQQREREQDFQRWLEQRAKPQPSGALTPDEIERLEDWLRTHRRQQVYR